MFFTFLFLLCSLQKETDQHTAEQAHNNAMHGTDDANEINDLKQDLLMISHMFVEASSYYIKDDCYQKASKMLALDKSSSTRMRRSYQRTQKIRQIWSIIKLDT